MKSMIWGKIYSSHGHIVHILANMLHATDIFWYSLKTSENQGVSKEISGIHVPKSSKDPTSK